MQTMTLLKRVVAVMAAAAVGVGVTAGAASEDLADPLLPSTSGGTASEDTPASADPAANHWAVIVGINDYMGSTRDLDGSVGDAQVLYRLLRDHGWKKSNIKLLLDYDATAKGIKRSLRWLADNTNERSTVVFHYAGHEMPFYSDVDGDREYRDVAIWAADNRYVYDGTLGRLLGKVEAKRMWIHISACRAGGFRDAGMIKDGRVLTFSSPEEQLSYEDPSVQHSVFGLFTLRKGMMDGNADRNGNGKVSVEETFRFAKNRVKQYTSDRQHPRIVDRLDGAFRLTIPEPKQSHDGGTERDCPLGICLP